MSNRLVKKQLAALVQQNPELDKEKKKQTKRKSTKKKKQQRQKREQALSARKLKRANLKYFKKSARQSTKLPEDVVQKLVAAGERR